MTTVQEQASALRRQGYTYPEISSALNGAVSVDWCKRNLKGVKGKKKEDPCVSELIKAGTTDIGCSDYEAVGIVFKHYEGADMQKVRSLKSKAKQLNSKCVFRPDWMDPKQPVESHKAINAYALHLMDEIDNLVRHYKESFPDVRENSVRYELLKLSCSSLVSPEPLAKHIGRNEQAVEDMMSKISAP